ncbi:hypothetical protein LTR27_002363 [Elasticomyces elasticus]|nr:hypothetical protein LTR27_002363 [Elasticomyces elasticus]
MAKKRPQAAAMQHSSVRAKPRGDQVIAKVEQAIRAYRAASFANYINIGLEFSLVPTGDAREILDSYGKWLGYDKYTLDVWGEDQFDVRMSLWHNGEVRIWHRRQWVAVADYLRYLKVKIDPTYSDGTPEMRSKVQARWWKENGKSFPLFELPRELRDLLYGFYFGHSIEPRYAHKARPGAIAKASCTATLMRLNRRTLQECRELLNRQTPFLIKHRRTLRSLLVEYPDQRHHVRRLELALSHSDFLKLFGFPFEDNVPYEAQSAAKVLAEMSLKHLIIRIAAPSLITGCPPLDGGCQRVITRWILSAAWPYVGCNPVEIQGYVTKQQKDDFAIVCIDEQKNFETWNGQRLAIGYVEGTWAEYNHSYEPLDDQEDGGVRLIERPEGKLRHLIPESDVLELPPRCDCEQPCFPVEDTNED